MSNLIPYWYQELGWVKPDQFSSSNNQNGLAAGLSVSVLAVVVSNLLPRTLRSRFV